MSQDSAKSQDLELEEQASQEEQKPETQLEHSEVSEESLETHPAEELGTDQEEEKVSFTSLGVSEQLAEALREQGWKYPTEIQEKSLPFSLSGKDLAGFAQTGTGKTGAFLITFAEKLLASRESSEKKNKAPLALIICPTRELAVQIEEEARCLLGPLGAKTLAVYGGSSIEPQINSLKKGVDLVVATPGRLLDLENQSALKLGHLKLFICDEVDRMFDMGFSNEVESILSKLPRKVQKLAFSATSDKRSKELCEKYLDEPKFVSLNQVELTPETIQQHLVICENEDKIKLLMSLLGKHDPVCAIVFTNTKLVASWLLLKLEKNNFNAKMISGDLPQSKRTKLITDIKNGNIKILIATDVASRGLHISGVSHVYNFDLPDDPANYVHRIGRTARAGASGESYSFICEDYAHNYENIKRLLGDKLPQPSRLDKSSLADVEDLAKGLYGQEDLTRSSFRHEERERGGRDSYQTRRSHSSERPSSHSRRHDSRSFESQEGKRHERNFDKRNSSHPSKRSGKQNSYGNKSYSSHSKKGAHKKGFLGKMFSKLFSK